MIPASAGVQRFSTDMFSPRERITAWREFIGRKWYRVEIEPQSNEEFEAESAFRVLPGMSFIMSRTKGARFDRAAHLIENDDVFLCVARAGTARYAACGRETDVEPGDAVLVGGGEASVHVVSDAYRRNVLRLPRTALAGAVRQVEDSLGRSIPAQHPALRLLSPYLHVLENGVATPSELHLMAAHMRDLVVLALGATGEAADAATESGARAARLRAIKADIEANLHEPRLSTATVAARHHLSERALQRLFGTEGISCTAFILERRLARAHRMLTDPRFAGQQIKTIAFDAGFAYLSQFTSAFRSRFGVSASEVRAQALQAHDSDT
jgi:AraC-like DNA-binding protein